MKIELKLKKGTTIINSIVYCDPPDDKLNQVFRDILALFDTLKK
jgi:hypothetical protein